MRKEAAFAPTQQRSAYVVFAGRGSPCALRRSLRPTPSAVFARFIVKILADESATAGRLTAEQFKKIINEVKAETGAKGKELFHPIRIVITGSHSGPDFDKLIPILEAGSHLKLPKHVLSVRERVEEFGKAQANK